MSKEKWHKLAFLTLTYFLKHSNPSTWFLTFEPIKNTYLPCPEMQKFECKMLNVGFYLSIFPFLKKKK